MPRGCPYCEAPDLEWHEADRLFRCLACGRSVLDGAESEKGSAEGPSRGQPPGQAMSMPDALRPRRAPGEGSALKAAGLGLGATLVFYAILFLFPDSALFELFARRGWVPYVITLISSWALSLLFAKSIRLRSETAVLSMDLLALPRGDRLRPDEADQVAHRIASQPEPVSQSFLADRLTRALRYFEARRRVVEVVEHLAAESRADDLRVDASYSLVRVFVWAVPTLGFIGTVIGIGGAVGGFSEALDAAASLDGMKESIGSVTGGLGVAFDTTLLALVMSILIMFPANAIQRAEEDLLAQVDDYCTQRLVQRLEDAPAEPEESEALATSIAAHLAHALAAKSASTS